MDEEDRELMESLVKTGDFEAYTDPLGKRRYRPTDLFYQRYPEAGEMWNAMIGETLFSLWSKGFLEIEFLEDGEMAVYPMPDPSKFDEINDLDEFERDILASIETMIAEGTNE